MPRLSIGLPVYNGERHISEALEALLGQTYEDFELIVSDNASTDGTSEICLRYARQDHRIRYIRQARNIGLVPNHIFVLQQARGELFKSAAHDDLYARDLLARCVTALDEDPHAVLAHAWSAVVDSSGSVVGTFGPGVALDAPRAADRFRSVLYEGCHDYEYAVIRTRALRRMRRQGSYHLADRMINAELVLHGGFRQVEEWLYFRREHPGPLTQRRARALHDLGPAARQPSAPSGRPPLRRVRVGVCGGHPPGPPLDRRAVRVLRDPHPLPGLSGGSRERLYEDPLSPAPSIPVDMIVAGRAAATP